MATVVVEVRSISSRPVRRRGMRPLVEAAVADESGVMKVTFFNQPWLTQRYPPGTRLVLHGKFEARNRFRVQGHAQTTEAASGSGDVAHYAASEGLSSTQILALVRAHAGAIGDVSESLPALLRTHERLPERRSAVAAVHFAGDDAQALGRRRLAFEELLLVQLALLRRRRRRRGGAHARALDGDRELTARWLETMLPFTPTGDQWAAIETLDEDLASVRPMQRLLMGEVGLVKTVLALLDDGLAGIGIVLVERDLELIALHDDLGDLTLRDQREKGRVHRIGRGRGAYVAVRDPRDRVAGEQKHVQQRDGADDQHQRHDAVAQKTTVQGGLASERTHGAAPGGDAIIGLPGSYP